jgi:hypothetical protein
MVESVLPHTLESVIDDAHRRARRRRAIWGTVALAGLAVTLGVLSSIGDGGAGSGNAASKGAPGRHVRRDSAATPFAGRPVFFFGGIRRPPGGARLQDRHRLLAQRTAVGPAAIWTAPDWAVRGTCAWLTIGRAVYGGECRRSNPPRRGLSQVVPLSLRIKGQLVKLLWGNVGGDVASLELRFQDGSVTRLPLKDRVFFYVLPRRRSLVGRRPTRLIARDRSGRTLGARLDFTRVR